MKAKNKNNNENNKKFIIMIKVFATGNIGKDAETKTFGESSVTNFSIASNKKIKGETQTTWLNCEKWNAGKLSDYLKKGIRVEMFGELQIKKVEDKYFTTLRVYELEFGGSGSADNSEKKSGDQESNEPEPGAFAENEPDDLPF